MTVNLNWAESWFMRNFNKIAFLFSLLMLAGCANVTANSVQKNVSANTNANESTSVINQIKNVLANIDVVINSMQANNLHANVVQLLEQLKVDLMSFQGVPEESDLDCAPLRKLLSGQVLPELNNVTAYNNNIEKMGQLNTHRVITPVQAEEENKSIATLRHQIVALMGRLGG